MLRALSASLALAAALAYSSGYDYCSDTPSHSIFNEDTSDFAWIIADPDSGEPVSAFSPGAAYLVSVARKTGAFQGIVLGAYQGANPAGASSTRLGSLVPESADLRAQADCAGVTHKFSGGKTSVTARWTAPSAASTDVTFAAVVVDGYESSYYRVRYTLPLNGTSSGGGGGGGDNNGSNGASTAHAVSALALLLPLLASVAMLFGSTM
jgi:hypothetical protein